jgi:hypothetical protein
LLKFKWKLKILRKHNKTQAENYRKREKKRKLKFLLLPNPPSVVGVDNLGSFTLARSRVGHPLQRIDPAAPRVAPSKRSCPLLVLHYWSFHLMLHALSHVHAPLLHLLHMSPWISCKVMLAAHPCLSFACGLDESWWKGIQWCMHD